MMRTQEQRYSRVISYYILVKKVELSSGKNVNKRLFKSGTFKLFNRLWIQSIHCKKVTREVFFQNRDTTKKMSSEYVSKT